MARLGRDDWVAAALDAFERHGSAGVAVVPLAKALGVTRGSFYWHFDTRDELLAAALERWEREHSDAVLTAMDAVADPRERLRLLADRALSKPPTIFAQLLRGAEEPIVGAVLERSAQARTAAIAKAYRDCGLTAASARHRATVVYALYIGLAHLQPSARDRAGLTRELVALLVP
jgi:AcrR family transcriptional regulator